MVAEVDVSSVKRLPGRGRRLSARFLSGELQQLYISGDHLLVLRRVGYEETSKRFALADIQAITLQSNADRTILSSILLTLMMLFAAVGLISVNNGAAPGDYGMYVIYIPMMLCALLLLGNVALGPTCTVRVHTVVQIEDLTALRRQRAARKCLGILVPAIEAVQGTSPVLSEQPARASANLRMARGAKKQEPKAVGRGSHVVAFATTMLLGLSLAAEFFYESAAKDIVDASLLVITTILLLVAVIRQTNSTIPNQTRMLTWAILLGNGFAFMAGMYAMAFTLAFNVAASGKEPTIFSGFVQAGQDDPRWFDVTFAIWGVVLFVLSLFGLLSIRGYKLIERKPPEAGETSSP